MISAIAARKAAQAARQQLERQHAISSVAQPTPPSPSPQSPKRRLPSQPTKSRKKRKRESKSKPKHNASSPDTDVFITQNDVIVIESEDDDDRRASISDDSESDIEILSVPPPHLRKRAWSPSIPVHDSSEDEDMDGTGTVVPEMIIDLPARLARQPDTNIGRILSTYVPVSGHNVCQLSRQDIGKIGLQTTTDSGTVVVLEPGERLCILGTCKLTLLQGAITVNGVPLQPSKKSHAIFAPRSSPLPIIEGRTGVNSSITPVVNVPFLPQTDSALVLLQELQSNIRGLGPVCRTFDGVYEPSTLPQTESMSAPLQVPGLYLVEYQTRDLTGFVMPQTWSTALSPLLSPPTSPREIPQPEPYLIKGPKNAGKSTFARTLLNTLLVRYAKVAYLECDPGQSEFTPPGLVSLTVVSTPIFGPAHSHFATSTDPGKKWERAHFVGAVTPKTGWGPAGYLDCVRDLIEVWKVDLRYGGDIGEDGNAENDGGRVGDMIPLVVNMMGWTKGLGMDLTQKIEEMVDPTMVFEFRTDVDSPAVPISDNTRILEPVRSSLLSMGYTPADHRAISILSYFHAIFPAPNHDSDEINLPSWNTTLPLCAIPPYEVNLHAAFDQVVLLGAGSEDVVPDELARVLNGAVVAFVQSNHPSHFPSVNLNTEDTNPSLYIQDRAPPPPSESSCIGLGLIRGVSNIGSPPMSPIIVHILTPVPPSLLAKARILIKGEMELPIWGMLDFRESEDRVAGVEKGKVPYLQWGRVSEAAIGDERRRVRRNLMRRGQV